VIASGWCRSSLAHRRRPEPIGMLFNPRKSVCCHFGPQSVKVSAIKLGDALIAWVKSFKYLGHTFIGGHMISIDFHIIKRKFYAACNSILAYSRRNSELVKLQLVKSFCLPLLTYCLGANEVPRYKIKDLGVCWNDSFRKNFGFNRWESVKELQWHKGELPFEFIYDI